MTATRSDGEGFAEGEVAAQEATKRPGTRRRKRRGQTGEACPGIAVKRRVPLGRNDGSLRVFSDWGVR